MTGKYYEDFKNFKPSFISENLTLLERPALPRPEHIQTNLFDAFLPSKEDKVKCLTGSL